MENLNACMCGKAPTLIFSCSGASDVGEIADRAARSLMAEGKGKMYCLAGIGGHVSGILKTTESAGKVLVIDGCAVDCGKKTLEHAGLSGFAHLRVTDLCMEKGRSPVTDVRVKQTAEKGEAFLVS
jgi:uncharacterized metal-binding protein